MKSPKKKSRGTQASVDTIGGKSKRAVSVQAITMAYENTGIIRNQRIGFKRGIFLYVAQSAPAIKVKPRIPIKIV